MHEPLAPLFPFLSSTVFARQVLNKERLEAEIECDESTVEDKSR